MGDEGCVMESDPVVKACKKDVDRTLIRKNLRLTPDERVRQLVEWQRFIEEVKRAGRQLTEHAYSRWRP